MTQAVFLNGRFLQQSVTGVQRFSAEIMAAMDRLSAVGEWPKTIVLSPRGMASEDRDCAATRYQNLQFQEVGHTRGHLWEQTELAAATRSGILINLGNTAPVLAGSRQIVVIHDAGVFDTPESYSLRFRTWYKILQHSLARTGAQVATVSEFSRDRIVARLGLDPTRITVTYEGADHILRVDSDPSVLERHRLSLRQFVLVVGSQVAHKNLAALREAAAMLERRGMVIAVAGGGDSEVFSNLRTVGIAERRLGRVTDAELRALYESAACLLFPSRYEGFGLPPVEAMACSCPVLASRGGAVEEICGNGALYFAGDDRLSIVKSIERLMDEEGLAEELRIRGLARAAKLSWDASARALGNAILCPQ